MTDIKAQLRKFNLYLETALDYLVKKMKEQSRKYMLEILTERDMNATGNWAKGLNLQLERKRKYYRELEIWDKRSGKRADEDPRNVGAPPFFPNINAIKQWVLKRGLAASQDVDSLTLRICKAIAKRGLTDSSVKLYGGGTQINYPNTVYERLSEMLYDQDEIYKYLKKKIGGYSG